MNSLELPHTHGCLVCGRDNPHGLKLSLHVDPATGVVTTTFTPQPQHIGFAGIIHGGAVATVVDEAMVWAATWNGRRFCVCGELTVRFRAPAVIGVPLKIEAKVEYSRPKLIQVAAMVRLQDGSIMAAGDGKYIPMSPEQSEAMMRTLIDEPQTHPAAALLTRGLPLEKDD